MNRIYPYKTYIIALSIVALGVFLRLYNLGKFSLWFDEGITLYHAQALSNIFKGTECVSPLYLLLAHYWKIFFGYGEFGLRLLSVILGAASLAGIYFLGRLFFDAKTAIIGCFLLAISPLNINYSQELTAYSLFTFLVLLSVYFLKRALDDEKWILWISFAFFSALSVLSHYIAVLILFSEVIFFLFFHKRYRHLSKRIILSYFLIFAFLSPWLLIIMRQIILGIKVYHANWWVPPLSWRAIVITFKNFSIGYNATPNIYFIATGVYFFFFAKGVHYVIKKGGPELLLFIILIPMFCSLLLLKFNVRVYVDRYFLPNSIFYYLIIAKGISILKNKYFLAGTISFIAVFNGCAIRNYYINYLTNPFYHHIGVQKKPDFRNAAYYIATNFEKGDTIIHTNENSIFSLEYYLNSPYCNGLPHSLYFSKEAGKRLWAKSANGLDLINIAKYDLRNPVPNNQNYFSEKDLSLRQFNRIWVVMHIFDRVKDGLTVLQWIDRHYKRIDEKEFYGLKIYLYDETADKQY